ncbi:MAG: flagellar assembly protein FliH [Campylobacterota bacterium]|nr:flagellar assembly protein FliH [Campylobacterota bacterium]
MAIVITSDKLAKHNVNKYNFKVLAMGGSGEEMPIEAETENKLDSIEDDEVIDSSALSNSSKESLIESLMKKTDDMSSNFIKLQMKLEAMSQEHKDELLKVKEESFNEGVEVGKKRLQVDDKTDMTNTLAQLSDSIVTLNSSATEYEKALEGIKSELIGAAIDISQEVITVELGENSSKIAEILSSELIKELQSASKITLKVNPINHGDISKNIGSLEHIEVISDSAVSEGGVIAISDAGNIDAQISKRFQRVKKAALSE